MLNKNNKKIMLKIKRDKNAINAKNTKTLLLINSTLTKYKTQRVK